MTGRLDPRSGGARLACRPVTLPMLVLALLLGACGGGSDDPPFATAQVSGSAEVRDEDGEWRPLADGDEVAVSAVIRTSDAGEVTLELDEGGVIRLAADSTLQVGERDEEATVALGGGQVEVEASDSASIRVRTAAGDATVAEADAAIDCGADQCTFTATRSAFDVDVPDGPTENVTADDDLSLPTVLDPVIDDEAPSDRADEDDTTSPPDALGATVASEEFLTGLFGGGVQTFEASGEDIDVGTRAFCADQATKGVLMPGDARAVLEGVQFASSVVGRFDSVSEAEVYVASVGEMTPGCEGTLDQVQIVLDGYTDPPADYGAEEAVVWTASPSTSSVDAQFACAVLRSGAEVAVVTILGNEGEASTTLEAVLDEMFSDAD